MRIPELTCFFLAFFLPYKLVSRSTGPGYVGKCQTGTTCWSYNGDIMYLLFLGLRVNVLINVLGLRNEVKTHIFL